MQQDLDTKKEAAPLATEATSVNSSSANSVTQEQAKSQVPQGKTKNVTRRKNNKRMLYPTSRTRTIAIKFYAEQMPISLNYVIQQIRAFDKTLVEILMEMHNRDLTEDTDLWLPAVEKIHFHLIARCKGNYRLYVRDFMRKLGIIFRQDLDKQLWENKGVETVGDFTNYAMYLTHETPESLSNGGKFEYDLETCYENGFKPMTCEADLQEMDGFLVSNLSLEEIKQIREGYTRLDTSGHKLTYSDLVELDKALFELGYNYGNLENFINAQPWEMRSNAKRKTLEESYYRGIDARVTEDRLARKQIGRICVFIQGDTGTGKSYAALHSFEGKKVLAIEGGGTGKFDDLRAYTEAMVINDDTLPNCLNMADDYPCKAYKRCKGNQVWTGKYLIVTSNKTFTDWLKDCGITHDKHITAMQERFFICHMENVSGKNYMRCDDYPKRGDVQKVQSLINNFAEFQKKFNAICSDYVPAKEDVLDLSVLNAGVPDIALLQMQYREWRNRMNDLAFEDIQKPPFSTENLPTAYKICDFETWLEHYKKHDTEYLNTVYFTCGVTVYHGEVEAV